LSPGAKTVVDPCCGSGTLLFAAACAGAAAVAGVEREAALVMQAAANLAATSAPAAASRRQLAAAASSRYDSEHADGDAAAESAGDVALARGGADAPPPRVLCADSNRVRFRSERNAAGGRSIALSIVTDDGGASPNANLSPSTRVDAFVSNLPYGRVVGVVDDGDADAPRLALRSLQPLLAWLRPQASVHAYFSGVPLADTLRSLGFADVAEMCVDDSGRRFLCLATCGED
jgi:23S rRNA G2445 N2-methylase RlmL